MNRWTVVISFVEEWLDELDKSTLEQVLAAIELLEREGPQLGRPFVDRVSDSTFHNLKELRTGSSGISEIRILFIFDPRRNAVLLVGGDKSQKWSRWYRKNIKRAEENYKTYLEELGS